MALARRNIRIPGFYQLDAFIYALLYGKAKLANFENEMMDPKQAVKYGIFWIVSGVVAFFIGMFLLFVR